MESPYSGSAVIAASLLSSFFILSAARSGTELPLAPLQQQKQESTQAVRPQTKEAAGPSEARNETRSSGDTVASAQPGKMTGKISGVVTEAINPAGSEISLDSSHVPLTPPATYTATAYSLSGRTASGKRVSKGLIAADPSVLPLGTRVRLEAGSYSGEYMVEDTGGAVRGKRIDIWTPTTREACRFGRRAVKLTVLSYGPKRKFLHRKRSR
jgi:3D (Asp-Asp-Asp) domain-containing protein